MDIDLRRKEIFGMPLDKTKYLKLIDKILDIFSNIFGKDIFLLEKSIAIEHMGFFKIKYRYLPLGYDIVFENDRGAFSIEIYDDEGANNLLYRIEKFDSETTVENVKYATPILKNILEKNDFCLYITREGKLYRKKNRHYKRVKDLTELMGDNDDGTEKQ